MASCDAPQGESVAIGTEVTQVESNNDWANSDSRRFDVEPHFPFHGWVAALSVVGCVVVIALASMFLQTRSDMIASRNLLILVGGFVAVVGLFLYMLSGYLTESTQWHKLKIASSVDEQERRFRLLFDAMPQLGWTARPDGFIDFYNRGWYEYTGTTYSEMQGWGWEKVQDPKTLPLVIERWQHALATGTPAEMILPLRRADGVFRWFLTRVNPIVDQEGKIFCWVGINTDIDEREVQLQEVNARLKSSERTLNLALDAAGMGVFDIELATGIGWHSLRHDQIFGYDELQPQWTYEMFLGHVIDADRSMVVATIDRSVTTGVQFNFECRISRVHDQSIRWISVQGRSFKDNGSQTPRLIGIVADITEHKKEAAFKEYLAMIVQSSSDAIISNTLEGIVTSWNNSAERMYGYSAGEILGRSISLLIPPERTDDLTWILDKLERGESVEQYETVRITKARELIDVSLTVSPIKDSSGKIVGACLVARDIGERKRADEALRSTKDFLGSIFQGIPDSILVVDEEGILVSINGRALEMFGYSSEELLGKPIEMLVPERFQAPHTGQNYFRDLQARSVGGVLELYAQKKDGGEFPADIMLSRVKVDHKTMVMAVVRDLTERHKLEAERKKAADALKAQDAILISPKTDPVLVMRAQVTSRDLAVLSMLFAFVAMIGCVFNIDILRNPMHWGSAIKFNVALCLFLAGMAAVAAQQQGMFAKFVLLSAGTTVTVITALTLCEWLFGWNLHIDQLLVPEVDVHAGLVPGRGSGSANLAFLFLGLGLVALNWKRTPLSQFCALVALCIGLVTLAGHTYGFSPLLTFGSQTQIAFPMSIAIILIAASLLLVHPEEAFAQVVASPSLGGRVLRRLMPLVLLVPSLGIFTGIGESTSTDTLILVATITVVFPAVVWLVATLMDRLDRQKDQALDRAFARREELELSNQQLKDARDQALEASNLKSAFVANISHELRTPLSGIMGSVELLLCTSALSKEQKEILETSLGCSQSLLQIVNDLLDLSKIESGKFPLEASSFDLPELINSVASTLSTAARQKGLELRVNLDPRLPCTVVGDPGRLRQVLLNLLNNAVKFTHVGGVSLNVVPEEEAELNTSRIRFEVVDTGIGIALDAHKLLFKPFSQVDGSVTRKYGGAGLGLSLCKNLVELMGGVIGVESTHGKGSVFWFEVPLKQGAGLDFSPQVAQPVGPLKEFGGKVVLVVEDSLVMQKLVVKQLSSLGVQSLSVANGSDALAMMSGHQFDLILMDCNLPDISGLDVTREIRQREVQSGEHAPIVAMTAAAMKGDRENCLAAGMDDYLSKPVSIVQLEQTLRQWLSPGFLAVPPVILEPDAADTTPE